MFEQEIWNEADRVVGLINAALEAALFDEERPTWLRRGTLVKFGSVLPESDYPSAGKRLLWFHAIDPEANFDYWVTTDPEDPENFWIVDCGELQEDN